MDQPEETPVHYIWKWFESLTDWRQSGWGIGALSHLEIESWARLMRIEIFPSEVEALRRLDRTFRAYYYKKDHPDPLPLGQQIAKLSKK